MPHTFFARFPGVCDACGGPIEKGSEVAYAGEKVLVHATCPEEAPEQKAPVCSTCNLTKPCDCEEDDMTDVREDSLLRVVQRGWAQLDKTVDEIGAAQPEIDALERERKPDLEHLIDKQIARKAAARGKAEILAVAMNIGWPLAWKGATADDVAAEAGRRAAMRREGREYGTIGVESSTVHLHAPKAGWVLAPDKRGVIRIDGGA